MPITGQPDEPTDLASTVLALFGRVHDQVREEIAGLDEGGLNRVPGPDTNSIATIVTHVVGSEAETIRAVAGVAAERDRDGDITHPLRTLVQLTDALEQADLLLTVVGSQIDADRLRARLSLPTLPAEDQGSGITWLVANYGHAREHVGQIQLTKQLYGLA